MEPPPAFSNAPPVQDEGLGPLNGQQPEAKAPNRSINDIPHEEDDVRNKAPKKLGRSHENSAGFRSRDPNLRTCDSTPTSYNLTIQLLPAPKGGFSTSFRPRFAVRGEARATPRACWPRGMAGSNYANHQCPVDITEEDLEPHVHPSVAACCEEEGMRSQRSLSFQYSAMQSYDTPP